MRQRHIGEYVKLKNCKHDRLQVVREKDRCRRVLCLDCRKFGPRKHSRLLAILAFELQRSDGHPRRKS